MGYPELIANPDDWPTGMTKCDGHFSKNTADEMRGWAGDLNATLGSSVTKVNALVASKRNDVHFTFVNPVTGGGLLSPDDENLFEPANGPEHELCATGNAVWMNGLQIENLNGSFHPNQLGEAAMGVLGAEVIRQLKWDIAPGWRQLGDPPVEPTEDSDDPPTQLRKWSLLHGDVGVLILRGGVDRRVLDTRGGARMAHISVVHERNVLHGCL